VVSRTDAEEAFNVGYLAAKKAFEGNTGEMVIIKVDSRAPYVSSYSSFDIHEIANVERKVPDEWITNDGTYVSDECVAYLRPLIMGEIDAYYSDGVPVHISLD
jgi:6-phosphofructokinase 1